MTITFYDKENNIIYEDTHFLKLKKLNGYVKVTNTRGETTSIANFDRIEVR